MSDLSEVTTTNIVDSDFSNVSKPSKKAAQKAKLKHSNFFITINSNQRFVDVKDPAFKAFDKTFRNAIDCVFSKKQFGRFIQYKGTGSGSDVRSVRISAAAEIGDENHCLHYHILVCVSHHTCLQLKIAKIREEIADAAGVDYDFYIDVKAFSKAERNIEEYINKNVKW